MNVIPARDIPAYVDTAPAIPEDKDRSEVRVYASVVTGATLWSLLVPVYYLLRIPESLVWRVAVETGYPVVFAALFALTAAMLIPHLFALLFRPQTLRDQRPRKIACAAMVAAGVLWGMLATEAKPLGYELLPALYWASSFGYFLVGGAFGYSLNAQQGREKRNHENQPEIS